MQVSLRHERRVAMDTYYGGGLYCGFCQYPSWRLIYSDPSGYDFSRA